MDDQPRKDNDKQIRARRPSKRPKKSGKQRRAREKEGTQMTNFRSPTPAAGGPDRQTRKPEFKQKANKFKPNRPLDTHTHTHTHTHTLSSPRSRKGCLRKRGTRSRRCVHNNTQRHNNTDAESHSPNLIHRTEIRMSRAWVAEGVPAGCEHRETQSNTRTYGTKKSSYVHAYIWRDGKWRKRVQT